MPSPHYNPLLRSITHGLRHRCGVGEGDRLLIACSGGADSVAMLRALHLLHQRRRWQLTLTVAHVQHHLRPDDLAEGDATFVQQLATELGLAHLRRDIHPGKEAGNAEANARQLRYQALADMARQVDATHIATAHHGDDQLETVLMALLRGTTAKGLRGIAWQRPLENGPPLIRPLLGATHAQALSFLTQLDQPWREDTTNQDRSRTRARLRHDVLPILRELRPSVARKVVEMTDSLRDK